MPKAIKIKTKDSHYIHGVLDGALTKPLFIFVHGLPGNIEDGINIAAGTWFSKHGFATFRFNLYDWRKGARQLIDCTLETHAHDLDMVVRHFKKQGVKKIFVAGHSFGGPTILLSKDQRFDAAALWDPSFESSFTKERYGLPGGRYLKEVAGYMMSWGANIIIGKDMARHTDDLDWQNLPKKFHKPLKIIVAQKGVLLKGSKVYLKNAHEPKQLHIIKEATHYFNDGQGMQEELFKETKKWFDAHK